MLTLDDMPSYALIQHSLPEPSLEFINLSPDQRQDLLEEFGDETDPDSQEMADFLDLGDKWSTVTFYDERPDGWPEDFKEN